MEKGRDTARIWFQRICLSALVPDSTSRSALCSATGKLHIQAVPEETSVQSGEIACIPIAPAGENGVAESNNDRKLTVTVEGGELLASGSANPRTEERYDTGSFPTCCSRVLAVVRVGESGAVHISISGEGLTGTQITL